MELSERSCRGGCPLGESLLRPPTARFFEGRTRGSSDSWAEHVRSLTLTPLCPSHRDAEGLRVFYYLVQDLKCLVFSLMQMHFRINPL